MQKWGFEVVAHDIKLDRKSMMVLNAFSYSMFLLFKVQGQLWDVQRTLPGLTLYFFNVVK